MAVLTGSRQIREAVNNGITGDLVLHGGVPGHEEVVTTHLVGVYYDPVTAHLTLVYQGDKVVLCVWVTRKLEEQWYTV